MADLHKQKYLKYKSKYNELKKSLNSRESSTYDLTDTTQTVETNQPTQLGGSTVNNSYPVINFNKMFGGSATDSINTDTVYELSDTPAQTGGANVTMPVITECSGIVNAQPSVVVGKNQTGGANVTMPVITECSGIVNAQPSVVVGKNQTGGGIKDDLSNMNDTDDMATLFKQLGGGKGSKNTFAESSSIFSSESDITSSSSIFSSESESESKVETNSNSNSNTRTRSNSRGNRILSINEI